jgi:cytoskeletal protein CcmA (bactofilin family)
MRLIRVPILVAIILGATAAPAAAADIRQGNEVVVGANQTVQDDLYAFGGTISILGTVRGDVVAAGGTISIDGTVTGDVIAAGSSIAIRGEVGGSVRAAGNNIVLDGRIGEDLVATGADITILSNGRVGRDVIAGGGTVTLGGQTTRGAQIGSQSLTIDGRVGGDTKAQVQTLTLTARAILDGSLTYTSPAEASIASGAVVSGPTEHRLPERTQPQTQGPLALAIDWVRGLIPLLALGLFLVFFFPAFSRRSGEAIVRSPLLSLGIGAGICIGLPILAVLIFIAGTIVGGWWLGLIALAFYFAAIAVSVPVAALGLGASILRLTQRPAHLAVALLVGLVVLLLLGLVPYLGPIVIVLAVLFGLGATAMAIAGGRRMEMGPA